MLNVEEIKEYLKNNLSNYRYEHSVRVAEEALELAKHYNCNENDAYIAGLLHDIAKEYSIEQNKEIILKYNLDESLLNDINKNISHAVIGSLVVKELYKVNDDICQAIKYHNIGNKDMSFFDKIIFIADKIECGKDYPGIEEEREIARKNIDEAVLLCLENNYKKLISKGKKVYPLSLEVLNYFKDKILN